MNEPLQGNEIEMECDGNHFQLGDKEKTDTGVEIWMMKDSYMKNLGIQGIWIADAKALSWNVYGVLEEQ